MAGTAAAPLFLAALLLLASPLEGRVLQQSASAAAQASASGGGQAAAQSSASASSSGGSAAAAQAQAAAGAGSQPAFQQLPASAAASASASASTSAGGSTAVAIPGSGQVYKGDGTAYSAAMPSGKGFACSYRYLAPYFQVHFAAINSAQWENGNNCGRCATVRCVDSRCPTQNKDVTVMFVDKCPECSAGDIDLSIPAYREITGSWPNRLTVQWQFSDCAALVDGTIKLDPKDGINAYWQAFFFSNSKYPLKRVSLNGAQLQKNEFQFWSHSGGIGSGPHMFEFEAENGQVVNATCADPLTAQDLRVQFD